MAINLEIPKKFDQIIRQAHGAAAEVLQIGRAHV